MFVLNTDRTFECAINVVIPTDGKPKREQFRAKFKIISHDKLKECAAINPSGSILDLVLVDVMDIEVQGVEDKTDIMNAVINDPCCAAALQKAYNDAIVKNNR